MAPDRSVTAELNLKDVLAQMLTAGDDAVRVVDQGGSTLGVVTLAAIRAHAGTHARSLDAN